MANVGEVSSGCCYVHRNEYVHSGSSCTTLQKIEVTLYFCKKKRIFLGLMNKKYSIILKAKMDYNRL